MAQNKDDREEGAPIKLSPRQKIGAGRFFLVRILGRGSLGNVWLAHDKQVDADIALKMIPAEVSADNLALAELRREVRKCRQLTHPHIIRVLDLHTHRGEQAFVATEYFAGDNLHTQRLERPQPFFPWKTLAPLAAQMCSALDYLHSKRTLHRAFKPANLLVDRDGRLKLADAAIAACLNTANHRVSARSLTDDRNYFSPQLLGGDLPVVVDDIYALGATLYELLVSQPPFDFDAGESPASNAPVPPLRERLWDLGFTNPVPLAVSDGIIACLSKDPAKRPQSARAVADLLGLEWPDVAEEEPEIVEVKPRRNLFTLSPAYEKMIWTGAVALGILFAILTIWRAGHPTIYKPLDSPPRAPDASNTFTPH